MKTKMKMKVVASSVVLIFAAALSLAAGPKQTMLMNRLGPSQMTLYIANADGSGERPLFASSGFDYNASFSPDGKWIVFTSERNGSGQADLYRVHVDGSGLERLTDDPALDDQAAFSPDGNQIAFVSTRGAHTANIWILDLKTRKLRNLTGAPALQAAAGKMDGFFRPSWSPDGAMDRVFLGPQFRFQAARISAAGMGTSAGVEHLRHSSATAPACAG